MRCKAQICVLTLACTASVFAQENLNAVLNAMDSSAKTFQSMTAKVTQVNYTKVIDDKDPSEGTLRVVQVKPNESRWLIEFTKPNVTQTSIQPAQVEMYNPKTNIVQVAEVGKYRSYVEAFQRLGPGGSGKDLSKTYTVKFGGVETINGEKTSRLELTPKPNAGMKELKLVEIWVTPKGYSTRLKLTEVSGDYRQYEYSDVKWNPGLTAADVELKVPANAKREPLGK